MCVCVCWIKTWCAQICEFKTHGNVWNKKLFCMMVFGNVISYVSKISSSFKVNLSQARWFSEMLISCKKSNWQIKQHIQGTCISDVDMIVKWGTWHTYIIRTEQLILKATSL